MGLSRRRAISSKTYIIQRGITKEPIIEKGYGETQLTNRCINNIPCSIEEHQKNRRTESKVVALPP